MAAEIVVRACTAEEWPRFLEAFGISFGFSFDEASIEGLARLLDPARQLVALDGSTIVGTAGIREFRMTVPGAELPVAGVTLVGVRPTHRRRGILRQMMRQQLDAVHARGESLAILWASEAGIYQRFGYGLATRRATMSLARGWSGFLTDSEPVGVTRLIDTAEALELLPSIYERIRPSIPGALARDPLWWELRRLSDAPWARRGGGELFRALLEIDGRPEGYALYRFHGSWSDRGLPERTIDVLEALGTSPLATREIWRFLFGVDIVKAVTAPHLCVDHPLFLMLADARRMRANVFDGTWVRIVEVAAALAARHYRTEGTLTFELADTFCAWNAGVWSLEASPDGATVTRATRPPLLRLSAAELAAMYLGTVSCSDLARAGRVEEVTAGAARLADVLFGWDVPPWCLDDF